MTNVSVLNAEATPYNQARNSQQNETDNRKGNFSGKEEGTISFSYPRDKEVRQVQFRHLLILTLE